MKARIIGVAAAAALGVPAIVGQAPSASAASAQVFVTGYVLRGYTATGTYVHPGTCAVDPRVIPLGSYITISGIGTCHAEDTGGAILGYHIDVWVPTLAQAYAITGWHTATWGGAPMQQVLGYRSTRHAARTVPTRPVRVPVARPVARPVRRSAPAVTYHRSTTPRRPVTTTAPVRPAPVHPVTTTAPVRPAPVHPAPAPAPGATTTPSSPYGSISFSGAGCRTINWTTYENGRPVQRTVTLCN